MSNLQNLEAERALYAFKSATTGNEKQKKSNNKFNYSAAVQEFPSMLRMNGLRATMAYYYSKGEQHKCVFGQIREWFNKEEEPTRFMSAKVKTQTSKKPEEFFMEILLKLTDDEYRIVQAEVLTLTNWLIRFVKTEDSNNQSNPQDHDAGLPKT
jgi:CRISPR type III-B/RAMP module-associated protein Cmr5